jgi:hypothetical protein
MRVASSKNTRNDTSQRHSLTPNTDVKINRELVMSTAQLSANRRGFTYDGQSSYTVSIMEFLNGKVARETQYFIDRFEPGSLRPRWVERMN